MLSRSPRPVVALALAAVLLSACAGEPEPYDGAADLVEGLYADGDVEAALEAVVEGSVDPRIADDVEASLTEILSRPAEVTDTTVREVQDVPVVEVRTDDGVSWCVRPDGRLLLACRVGSAPVEADPGDAPIDIAAAEVDVFADGYQLRLQLRAGTTETTTLEGRLRPTASAADENTFRLTQGALLAQGELVSQTGDENVALVPGATLLIAWATPDEDVVFADDLAVEWDAGTIALDVGEPTYLVDTEG